MTDKTLEIGTLHAEPTPASGTVRLVDRISGLLTEAEPAEARRLVEAGTHRYATAGNTYRNRMMTSR